MSTPRQRSALASALLSCVVLLLGVVVPAGALPRSASAAEPDPGPIPRIDPIKSPYGNPYNDFLRRPYGVLDSPQQQASLAPVADDPNEPFDFYRYPRAAIGVLGGPEESIITPEGYLQTVFGTLGFATGADRTPVDQRVKTWKDGYLPILEEGFNRDGVGNHVEFFAAKVPGVAKVAYRERYGNPSRTLDAQVDNMVNFVKVDLTNPGDTAKTYRFSVGLNGQKISATDGNTGPAAPQNPSWNASEQAYVGDGKLLFTASENPTQASGGNLDYDVQLAPGATKSLTFAMPYFVGQESDLSAIRGVDYDSELAQTAKSWHDTLDNGTKIEIPGDGVESKVLDTYKANLAFSLLMYDEVGGKAFWDANPTVYDHYYLRDTAFDIDGILGAGFTDLARNVALEMLDWQMDNGQFESQSGENDGNGQALWTFGNYYARTHDKAFAQAVWPAVQRAMDWEWQTRQASWDTDGGLFPSSSMSDNEGVQGHVLTYDLWNIAGESGAAQIAAAVGDDATAQAWGKRRDQYISILHDKLTPAVDQLGWIPPAVEGLKAPAIRNGWYGNVYGIDWGNLESVWPTEAFTPDDPWITSSLKAWRDKTFEGVFGYPQNGVESTLHSYTPMSIALTYVRRGDQWNALQDLYGLLTHTSATDMASEGISSAQRWGWSASDQTQPHGEFAGKYLSLLRDMLAYEGQEGSLHLANVWSPAWTQPGKRIAYDGDTDFGHVSYSIDVHSDGATMQLDPPTRNAPKSIVVSVPQNDDVTGVTVDGQSAGTFDGDRITLPALTHSATVEIKWQQREAAPAYSFGRAVKDYLANYHQMTAPADVHVDDVQVNHPTSRAGYPLQVKADVVNTGGASYLDDPRLVWYVDGKPVWTDNRSLANGIGFTTPKGIISFDSKNEGTVPVGVTTTLCDPGEHTIGVGLGGEPPTHTATVEVLPLVPAQDAPPAKLALHASPVFTGGDDGATATATITNQGCAAMTDVGTTLGAPDGWTVKPTSGIVDSIDPGRSATVTWQVRPPANAGGSGGSLSAKAEYGWGTDQWKGVTTGSATAQTTLVVCSGSRPPVDGKARAQWDFSHGCAADLSGHGQDGTVGPGVSFTDAGARFDGTDDGAIVVPYDASYQPETITSGQAWSLDLTGVVPAKVGGNYQALANARSTAGGFASGWTVYITPDGSIVFWMSRVDHTYAVASSGVKAVPGKRYDISTRWDGSRLSITVSGDGSGSGSASIGAGYLPDNGSAFTLGRGGSASSDDYFYSGTLAAAEISVQ